MRRRADPTVAWYSHPAGHSRAEADHLYASSHAQTRFQLSCKIALGAVGSRRVAEDLDSREPVTGAVTQR